MENEQPSEQKSTGNKHKNGTSTTTPTELRDALDDVTSSMSDLYRAADAFATEQARERPYVFLGVAAGIGFVLGGGLASRLGSTLLGVGSRLAVSRVLEELTTAAK
jgi:ElaB/YqjD/DUF883 family membrane-anchored ribosome-binding protein